MKATRESTRKAPRTPRLTRSQQQAGLIPHGEGASALHAPYPQAKESALRDTLSMSLSQLAAMLTTASAGFESFDLQAPKVKQNFLWACATLAADCERMIDQFDGHCEPVQAPERAAAWPEPRLKVAALSA